jgi:hypothetical protein
MEEEHIDFQSKIGEMISIPLAGEDIQEMKGKKTTGESHSIIGGHQEKF